MNEPVSTATIEMRDVDVPTMRDSSFIVVRAVNWSVKPGEFWVVGGQQHSGKSDLLLLAAGLMSPAAGDCCIFGVNIGMSGAEESAARERIGFVFQGGRLFNRLTVVENVTLPLCYQQNLTAEAAVGLVQPLLEMLELDEYANVTPANLAANWRARVALARALVLKPELLLLDNPFSGLGAKHRQWLLRLLDQLSHGHEWLDHRPMTLVVSTDDLRPWQSPARKFALLHDKTFVPLGSWETTATHQHPAVRELLAETVGTNY